MSVDAPLAKSGAETRENTLTTVNKKMFLFFKTLVNMKHYFRTFNVRISPDLEQGWTYSVIEGSRSFLGNYFSWKI
jgi:hypothetical protein